MQNGYKKYINNSIETMTQGDMLIKLYDELIKQLNIAKVYINDKSYQNAHKSCIKSQEILTHLLITLDGNNELSKKLTPLYTFLINEVVKSNVKKDSSYIEPVISICSDLRNFFKDCSKNMKIK